MVQEKARLSRLLKFGEKRHGFIYRSETGPNKTLPPCAVPGKVVGMKILRTQYRIYIPSLRKLVICRQQNFTIKKERLPSTHQMIDFGSLRRNEAESEMLDTDE